MRFIVICIILFPTLSQAADFKVRAREHYNIQEVQQNDQTETYRGFSNTFNFWWEEPFDISYGFAAGPLLGSATNDSSSFTNLGNRIRIIHLGGEIKYFLTSGLFTRGGAGWSQLRSDGTTKESNGYHGYLGLGWEFKIKSVGLAIEAAYRHMELQNEIQVGSFTPSIGLHFYNMF